MKILLLTAAFLITSLVLSSCKKDNPIPPEDQPQINLSLAETSCTEAWLKLTTTNISLPAEVNLKRTDANDSSKDEIFFISTADTILYVDSLLPNTNYKYQASSIQHQVSSNLLNVTTMDTTSHNFTWQTFTFGNPNFGSSELNDVAIIDENNIWAVGEIYNDTTGQLYNAAHWDGSQWELKRIKTNACGGVDYPAIQAIFAFSADDIIFAHIDGSISHYDGINFTNNCSLITQLNGSVNKIWGISNNDYYVVSDNGFIAHYQNGTWNRIESGTDGNLRDIYGVNKPASGKLKILATAEKLNAYRIFAITSSMAEDTLNWQPGTHLSGIWLDGRKTYAAGTDIWVNQYNQWQQKTYTGYFYTTIRGSKSNNIYGIGPDGIVHFNGLDWQLIKQRPAGIVMKAGNCSRSLVAAVGFSTTGGSVGEAIVLLANQLE